MAVRVQVPPSAPNNCQEGRTEPLVTCLGVTGGYASGWCEQTVIGDQHKMNF